MGSGEVKKQIRVNAISFAEMVAILHEEPISIADLAEATGLHVWTIRHYTRALYERKVIHIAGWEKDRLGRSNTPLWFYGRKKDIAKPHETNAEKMVRLRARKRLADPFRLNNEPTTRAS